MPSQEELIAYITRHPEASDRSIAKHFGISRKEATTLRATKITKSTSAFEKYFTPLSQGNQPYVFLFCLALAVRFIALFFFRAHPETTTPIRDAAYYITWAKEILSQGILGTRPFFTEPLYAYLLAFFFKLSSHG
jgi:hypothetical protein